MAELTITDPVYIDLTDIEAYISPNAPVAARNLIDKMMDRIYSLASAPYLGRIVPEAEDPGLRELIEGNYRIIYRVLSEESVAVLRVVHSKRKLRL